MEERRSAPVRVLPSPEGVEHVGRHGMRARAGAQHVHHQLLVGEAPGAVEPAPGPVPHAEAVRGGIAASRPVDAFGELLGQLLHPGAEVLPGGEGSAGEERRVDDRHLVPPRVRSARPTQPRSAPTARAARPDPAAAPMLQGEPGVFAGGRSAPT
jgi:hypothetical protein